MHKFVVFVELEVDAVDTLAADGIACDLLENVKGEESLDRHETLIAKIVGGHVDKVGFRK